MDEKLQRDSYEAFHKIYTNIKQFGKLVAPRGQKVLEIENYSFTLPPYVRFASFEARKLKLDYIKKEFLWYLKGDRYDLSITEQASMWKTLINKDDSINSNYGQYIFYPFAGSNQFDKAIKFLSDDKDSRRASVMILGRDHILSDTNDLPCTYGMNFRIRDDKLNMSVMMRSMDAIFGMCNDIPTFSFTHEMVYMYLKDTYPNLELGTYYHNVNSAHVYERHFEMLDKIVDSSDIIPIDCPKMSNSTEASMLRSLHIGKFNEGSCGEFIKWITDGTCSNSKQEN